MFHRLNHKINKSICPSISLLIVILLISLVFISSPVEAEPSSQISINPSTETVSPEMDFTVGIYVSPDEAINGITFSISYDASLIHANSVTLGDLFEPYTPSVFFDPGTINNTEGYILNVYGLIIPGTNTVEDPGFFCNISFSAQKNNGTSNLILYNVCLTNATGDCIKDLIIKDETILVGDSGKPVTPPDEEPPTSNNAPNSPSKPSGASTGFIETSYSYSTSTIDLDEDEVYYLFDWGDESTTSWIGPYNSGVTCIGTHSWNRSGTYNIKVKAKDIHNNESSWSIPLTIEIQNETQIPKNQTENISENLRPTAIFTFTPTQPKINENINFIDKSIDEDGNITKWLWDFGDTETSSLQNSTHQYTDNRTYIVTLTVWDDTGTANIAYQQIEISEIISKTTKSKETPGFISLIMFIALIVIIFSFWKKRL